MSCNQVFGEGAVVSEDVDDLSIGKLVAGHDILAVNLGSNHVVSHICVHMVGEVHHCRALHIHSTGDDWYCQRACTGVAVSGWGIMLSL